MSGSTALTGRNGAFWVNMLTGMDDVSDLTPDNAIARITQWAVNPTLATSTEWGDSGLAGSNGFTNRAAGRDDNTFTAEGKYDTGAEVFDIFEPEDFAAAALILDDSDGDLHWSFPRAMCTDFNITVNIDTEEVIGWTSSWGSDGIFYRPGQDGAPAWALTA